MTTTTKPELITDRAEAIRLIETDLRSYVEQSGKLTDLYRNMAIHVVSLRSTFVHSVKGTEFPDWLGRSAEYKEAISAAYKSAGFDKLDKTEQNRMMSGIRYHVSDVVRQVAPKKDRDALGLKAQSQKEAKSTQARTPEARVTIPSVKLTESAQTHAIDVARRLTEQDCVGTVEEALGLLRIARSFPVPTDTDSQNMLLMLLSALTTETVAYVEAIKVAQSEAAKAPQAA